MSLVFPADPASHADVQIRPATAADAVAIAEIWRGGWRDAHLGHVPDALVTARTPESFARRSRERIGDTIVATRADEVVGFAMTQGDEIDQLYTGPAARGTGIGGCLLAAAERAARHTTGRSAWLAVATGNAPARRFYARQGWTDEGRFAHAAPVPGGTVQVDCHRFRAPSAAAETATN
ncbi:GCN5 family acetyltransferase [Microbacterium sediminis]|uniref:GCN5 family acetyltransferase n=2 Tax=Microbacterium sediminis TaxID=904291 RepID=A0A1B9NF65_9MICO|nr:GCN5 family acetyltransferase [Microbacterium sediminis]QBR75444.1 GNAT family N-acetyltransferase [Microbacterium sediminis]